MHNFLVLVRATSPYEYGGTDVRFKVLLLNCYVSLLPRPETTRPSPCQQTKAVMVSLDGRGPPSGH